ncbi:MAG: C4-type zinc ribbon domain-containing protein [Porphyromonas sp.]|nr:C4-type zinc ribbon domain-containing protein [Porphyromonas sp.]
MAKNISEANAKELSIRERLKALYQLQIVSSKIDRIRTIRGELPLEVQELEDELEGRKTRYHKMEEECEKLQEFIEQNQERIRVTKQKIEKYEVELNEIRNNREYDMISKELENQKLDVQLYEKEISEDQARIEHIKGEMALLMDETKERTEILEMKHKELDEIIAETKQEEDELQEEAKKLEPLIEPRVLTAFNRTRHATHNGLAVVTVEDEACLGCFNKIPPQTVLDLKAHRKIITCEYCGRILVDPELAVEAEESLEL